MKTVPQLSRVLALAVVCVSVGVGGWGPARAQTKSHFVISGTVLNLDGSAVHAARLSASADRPGTETDKTQDAETSADGHFQLTVPCPGIWRLSVEAQGYPQQTYGQHGAFSTGIVLTMTHPGHEVVFRLVPSSSVMGTVRDEVGDPVRDAKVFLLLPDATGEDSLRIVDRTTSDDRGMYEFTGVGAGGYEVAVQAQPWYAVAAQAVRSGGGATQSVTTNIPPLDPSLDVTYPITYYPSATDSAGALVVEVAGGTNQQADVRLSPVPSVHVVVPNGGRTGSGFGGGHPLPPGGSVPVIQELSEFGALRFEPTSINALPDGSLDVGGLSPGQYSLASARGRDVANQQDFTVAKDAGRTITLGTSVNRPEPKQESTGTLNGVVMSGAKASEGSLLLLVPVVGGDAHARRQQSNTDGSFRFEKVPVGRYILVGIDDGWSVDLKDPHSESDYLRRGIPVDFRGSVNLKTALQAVVR